MYFLFVLQQKINQVHHKGRNVACLVLAGTGHTQSWVIYIIESVAYFVPCYVSARRHIQIHLDRADTCVCKETHSDTFRQSRHMCLWGDTFRHIWTEQIHVLARRHIQTHLDRANTCVYRETYLDTFEKVNVKSKSVPYFVPCFVPCCGTLLWYK